MVDDPSKQVERCGDHRTEHDHGRGAVQMDCVSAFAHRDHQVVYPKAGGPQAMIGNDKPRFHQRSLAEIWFGTYRSIFGSTW
jgi:hypothetical protein